jgi:hypothetical protein
MTDFDSLELIIESTPAGARQRALIEIQTRLIRYETVARKARLLVMATTNGNNVTKAHWSTDIIALTTGLPDQEDF